MATFGVSMPDTLADELDQVAKSWYANRSNALTRIFLEWKQAQTHQLPLAVELSPKDSPAADMRANGAQEFPLDKAA